MNNVDVHNQRRRKGSKNPIQDQHLDNTDPAINKMRLTRNHFCWHTEVSLFPLGITQTGHSF